MWLLPLASVYACVASELPAELRSMLPSEWFVAVRERRADGSPMLQLPPVSGSHICVCSRVFQSSAFHRAVWRGNVTVAVRITQSQSQS
ncbi:hypothetical protein BCV70DRAFT_1266 [Testicularia cyperi]|uniref:Secreted protein n=1 Tax=Testicularia cyperi TaxID=1882483 RepID=A0A317XYY5_9BASI|nr:hypothetical protein BCV70DRAFT_1266 [Testicularia cyperi]